MIAKIKTRVDFGGIVNYANDQKGQEEMRYTFSARRSMCY